MRWLYKIWGGYNGFRPDSLGGRITDGVLDVGWTAYADVANLDDEVWVYFFEGNRFPRGIYVKGLVDKFANGRVQIKVLQYSTSTPLTDTATSDQISVLVKPRRRQVFVYPEALKSDLCEVSDPEPASCAARRCTACDYWYALPLMSNADFHWPRLLVGELDSYSPAYWAVPQRRNFIARRGRAIRPGIARTNELFYRFKTGEEELAFPLAAAMQQALQRDTVSHIDAVIPIPLSPEKAARGELDRTSALGRELAALLSAPLVQALSLSSPISKRALFNQGIGEDDFRQEYLARLAVAPRLLNGTSRVLLIDDVCTHGNTLAAAASAIRSALPGVRVLASTAAQMALAGTVRNEGAVLH